MSLYARLRSPGATGFGYGSSAEEVTAGLALAGKTVLITGVSSGLGLETARVLRLRGAHVVGTARTKDGATDAVGKLPGGSFTALSCELAEPRSIRGCIAEVKRLGLTLDAVIANAGVMALPDRQVAHGCELQFFTNHVGHFALITGLLEQLSDAARVVMVSSDAHRMAPKGAIRWDDLASERSYSPWLAYGHAKMANILFATELARRFRGTARTANALHPGIIRTNLGRNVGNPLLHMAFAVAGPIGLKSIPQGAATQCYVAVHPGAAEVSGEYWSSCNIGSCRADARDPEIARRLWDVTERIVASLP